MDFWEGKCFSCIWWGTLAAILSISTVQITKQNKKIKKHEKVIINSATSNNLDSTSRH